MVVVPLGGAVGGFGSAGFVLRRVVAVGVLPALAVLRAPVAAGVVVVVVVGLGVFVVVVFVGGLGEVDFGIQAVIVSWLAVAVSLCVPVAPGVVVSYVVS